TGNRELAGGHACVECVGKERNEKDAGACSRAIARNSDPDLTDVSPAPNSLDRQKPFGRTSCTIICGSLFDELGRSDRARKRKSGVILRTQPHRQEDRPRFLVARRLPSAALRYSPANRS